MSKQRVSRKQQVDKTRRQIAEAKQQQLKLRELVREYVAQRPEVTIKVIRQWLK